MDFKTQESYESLLKTYKKLAKRADQRLVRLEGYRHDKGYENITSYAYRTAMKDIKSWSGEGATRFHTKAPANKRDLMKKIADIEKFLDAPTSTKKGVMNVYKKRADSLNKTFFGDDKKQYLTWQEWGNFWDKVGAEMLDKIYYSQAAKGAGIMKKYKITPENAKEKAEQLVRSDDIDVVEGEIIKSLAENGLTLDKLIRK